MTILEVIDKIEKKYVYSMQFIVDTWAYEFSTDQNKELMNSQIKTCSEDYINQVRQAKVDFLLDNINI